MVIHLATNASLLNGVATFQRAVTSIHSFGGLLPLIEWVFILLPLLFHGILGVWMVKNAEPNSRKYPFTNNKRYSWQRWTGLIAFVFLFAHVLHLHGWIHAEPWLDLIGRAGLGTFKPYNAASTLIVAMQGWFWPAFYLIGVWACVYHLANGLWTAGITWGVWLSAEAQARATKVATVFGILLAIVGTGAWWAAVGPDDADVLRAREIENEMYETGLKMGVTYDIPEKRWTPEPEASLGGEGQATADGG